MDTVEVSGDKARLPPVVTGTVTRISRYGKERAYVLHPDDFHRLTELESLAAAALRLPALTVSDTAASAHLDEDTPGASLTDPTALKALLRA